MEQESELEQKKAAFHHANTNYLFLALSKAQVEI
jgi:hypothetical protein